MLLVNMLHPSLTHTSLYDAPCYSQGLAKGMHMPVTALSGLNHAHEHQCVSIRVHRLQCMPLMRGEPHLCYFSAAAAERGGLSGVARQVNSVARAVHAPVMDPAGRGGLSGVRGGLSRVAC